MPIKVKLNYLRIAPRKARLAADLVRGRKVNEAKELLEFNLKKASLPLKKLLDSGVRAAKDNFQLKEEDLRISKITVDEGPKLKRFMPRARGRATEIKKRSSHITLVLEEEKKSDSSSARAPKRAKAGNPASAPEGAAAAKGKNEP